MEMLKAPKRGFFATADSEYRRWSPRSKRDVKVIERKREPFSSRLDVGFFPRPAIEEGFILQGTREGAKVRHLGSRKIPLGDPIVDGADELRVDSNLTLPSYG